MDTVEVFEQIQPYIVSLCKVEGATLSYPEGCGVLVKFSCQTAFGLEIIYGIITAYHVLEELDPINNKFNPLPIGILKQIGSSGSTHGSVHKALFIDWALDKKHYRRIKYDPKKKNITKFSQDENFERDLAFICLMKNDDMIDIDKMGSKFYDLDHAEKIRLPKRHNAAFVFYRGACIDNEILEDTLATSIQLVCGGEVKTYPISKIVYHELKNEMGRTMKGASGGGLWLFSKDDETVNIALQGIIVRQSSNFDKVYAIDISYLVDDFLPKLKRQYLELDKWLNPSI